MLPEDKYREAMERVMQTARLAGVKEFEEDLALLMIDLKGARLQTGALIAAMREALMRPERWREAITTALNDLDKPARRPGEGHCYQDPGCSIPHHPCMCWCEKCAVVKQKCQHKNIGFYHGLPGAGHCSDCGERI